jgi:hypothetical protein
VIFGLAVSVTVTVRVPAVLMVTWNDAVPPDPAAEPFAPRLIR